MANDPLPIIEEYLDSASSEPAVRRNAVTALAAVGSESGVARLVRVALDDPGVEVRQRAEEEIAALPPDLFEPAWRAAQAALEDRSRRRTAYGLLGRLRCRRSDLPPGKPPFRLRLRGSFAALNLESPGQTWRFRWAPAWQAALAAFLGGALIAILLMYSKFDLRHDERVAPVLMLLLVGPAYCWLAALGASQFLNPILLHDDRRLGGVSESVRAGVASFGVEILVFVVVALVTILANDHIGLGLLPVAATLVAVGLAARAGSVLGALGGRRPLGRALGGLIAGSTLGMLTCTAVTSLIHGFDLKGNAGDLLDLAWLVALPTSIGLAWIFSRLDRWAPVERQGGSFAARAATVALGGLAIYAVVMLPAAPRLVGERINTNIRPLGKLVPVKGYKIRRTPLELQFNRARPEMMRAGLTLNDEPATGFRLTLYEGREKIEPDKNGVIETSLRPGPHQLTTQASTMWGGLRGDVDLFDEVTNRLLPWFYLTHGHKLNPSIELKLRVKLSPLQRQRFPAGYFIGVGDRVCFSKPKVGAGDTTWSANRDPYVGRRLTVRRIQPSAKLVWVDGNDLPWEVAWVSQIQSENDHRRLLPGRCD